MMEWKKSGSEQTPAWSWLWVLCTHGNKTLLFQLTFNKIYHLQQKHLLWATILFAKLLDNNFKEGKGWSRQKEIDGGSNSHIKCRRMRSGSEQQGFAEQSGSYTSLHQEYPTESRMAIFCNFRGQTPWKCHHPIDWYLISFHIFLMSLLSLYKSTATHCPIACLFPPLKTSGRTSHCTQRKLPSFEI